MPKAEYFTQFFIKIGGQDVPVELADDLAEVVVDTSLDMPDMFTMLIHDYNLKWVDSNLLDFGKEVEIKVETGSEQGNLAGTLIKGEITALEPHFSSDGRTSLLVRGYDKSHRLHRGRKTRTFAKQTDSDIVQKIAGEIGLTPQTDATNITYDFVLQNNQTNMEFLLARAARIGYQVYAAEGKLYFKKGDTPLGTGSELKFTETLISFQPRLTTSGQADKIIVKGWDPKGKKPIMAQATPNSSLNQGGTGKTGGATAQKAFGSAEAVIVDQPVFTSAEASSLATGLSNDISREFIQAEGTCMGDPGVKAGWTITIKGVGQRFSGKYFVTSAMHIYNAEGYETRFTMSGRQPNTLSHLLESDNGHHSRGLVQGVVTGLVTNLNDPDNLGRIKVKYAWLGEIESDWVRMASPMGGGGRGFFYLPEVNDEVLLTFEHGDVHRPYVIGFLWSSPDKPPEANDKAVGSGKVNQRILRSRSGHIITLDDTDGQEKITIRDKTTKNELMIDSAKNSMTIKVDGDFSVEAKGKITLNSVQNMSLNSKANLAVEATGNGDIKGTQLTLEGTAKGALKAPMVSLEGQAMAEVKAGLVKIN
ncbi:MAG: VgrG-related protein [Chloroflexi bacterium]|nr:VgrG-related protein [Chloroflexota bacterium]